MTDQDILTNTYKAFNARDMGAVLSVLHPDVDWSNGMEGGRVLGRSAVQDYWTRQWQMVDPHVEPQEFVTDDAGRITVTVHQVVRDLNGTVLIDQTVYHRYRLQGGLVWHMEILDAPEEPKVATKTSFPLVTPEFAQSFAEEWGAAWNAHDLERILSHYADDFSMASPFIAGVVGEPSGRLSGKEAIRAYWKTALERNPDLRFVLQTVFCGADTVAVLYESVGRRTAIEHFRFNASGLVCEASAQYDRF